MIVVFGSINLDLVARVARMPRPGETLAGDAAWNAVRPPLAPLSATDGETMHERLRASRIIPPC